MKNLFYLIFVLSLFTNAQANERVVYGNDFEIIRNTHDGDQSVSIGESTVIIEGDLIEASIQMTSGPSCLFEGVRIDENTYGPTEESKEYGETCRVTLDLEKSEQGETLSVSHTGNCVSFCGAGAELKTSGLRKF